MEVHFIWCSKLVCKEKKLARRSTFLYKTVCQEYCKPRYFYVDEI